MSGPSRSKNKELGIYRVEYEIQPSLTTYTAFIVSFTPEEVYDYLELLIGRGKVNMTSIGFQCYVHGMTPTVREHLTSIGVRKDAPETMEEALLGRAEQGKKPIRIGKK